MFKAEIGPHAPQLCIQMRNPSEKIRNIVRAIVMNNWIDDEEYKVRTKAGAFLQCDYEDYLLVEFWGNDYQPFIDLINKKIKEGEK